MFIMEVPDAPPKVIQVAQTPAGAAQNQTQKFDGAIGHCRLVYAGSPYDISAPDYALLPVTSAAMLQHGLGQKFDKTLWKFAESGKVTVLQAPKHGRLVGQGNLTKYYPEPSYVGKDQVTFMVEVAGYKIKVLYILQVQHGEDPDGRFCPKDIWKISSTLTPNDTTTLAQSPALDLASAPITFTLADLPGQSLGLTSGTSITLDTNGAGHGWYFDWLGSGDDWLPTSDPQEWMAISLIHGERSLPLPDDRVLAATANDLAIAAGFTNVAPDFDPFPA